MTALQQPTPEVAPTLAPTIAAPLPAPPTMPISYQPPPSVAPTEVAPTQAAASRKLYYGFEINNTEVQTMMSSSKRTRVSTSNAIPLAAEWPPCILAILVAFYLHLANNQML